jgi:class 3 adenylate cyclase/predicted ATPase
MMPDVERWLQDLGLAQYARAFAENDVDFDILPDLGERDLEELGVSLGHRRKLLRAIAALSAASGRSARTLAAAARSPSRAEAERRQLTVMFVDLVGSTALSARLDPEDIGQVFRAYRRCCGEVVQRWEGHVAKYMGDGVLAYFGWPRAHEDDAERAVRAGLELAAEIGHLSTCDGVPLAARIGIATGQVVVGDLVGEGAAEEEAVVGETPNLAARLQGLAEPGGVVIGPNTERLVAGLFDLTALGEHELRGLGGTVRVWRVVGDSRAESRFAARSATGLTPLVGRQHELGMLLQRFEQALEGEGQAVLLSGEPGIGKSRLAHALLERLADQPHTRVRCYCSPYHVNSALHPVIQHLERAAAFEPDDPPGRKLDKLEALLGRGTSDPAAVAPLFAALLSIPVEARYPPLDITAQRQRELTIAAMVDQLSGLAARQPVLLLLEDAQWIDPTTSELFERLIERGRALPVLLLITFRPEFAPPWPGYPHMTSLTLNRLGPRHSAEMIAAVAGGRSLPEEVCGEIWAKTEGVPLFVEELTKAVLESTLLEDQGDGYGLIGPLPPLAIPATLHDSLMARLDRLAPTKQTAQIGAVIGREFSYELIRAVAPLTARELDRALADLVQAELVIRRGTPPEATFVFKHVLVQDAAYGSLLRDRRRHLHARIAIALEQRYPDAVEQRPELPAHHFAQAGLLGQAATYWLKAGRRAAERSANTEAIAHLRKAIETLATLPETAQRARQELSCQLALGPALLATRGWSDPDALNAYTRAQDLCARLGEDRQRFDAQWGLWLCHSTRGEMATAHQLTQELFRIAERLDDPSLRLQAHHAAWADVIWLGEPATALEHVEHGLAIYDPGRHRSHALVYGGHDPAICGQALRGLSLWLLGYPDRARRSVREAVAFAEQLAHAPSLAHAVFWAGLCHQFRRDVSAAHQCSDRLIALATEQKAMIYRAGGMIIRGWARACGGETDEGVAELRRGLEAYMASGLKLLASYFRTLLAEAWYRAGDPDRAGEALQDARQLADETAERFWVAASLQLEGEIALARAHPDPSQAEACFREAIDLARQQQARSLELRAATSLARLWAASGRQREARDLLVPVYACFTEGFATPDLKDAKASLQELS